MQITKQWLLTRTGSFWYNLLFILHSSPYFGKLGWAFRPGFNHSWQNAHNKLEESDLIAYRSAIRRLSDNANLEQIGRQLMTTIFWVAPDYNRTIITLPSLPATEGEKKEGFELSPRYPRYYVSPAPHNYRPLKDEEIQPEDLQMFQPKLQILSASFSESLLATTKLLFGKTRLVRQKLTEWTKLIKHA